MCDAEVVAQDSPRVVQDSVLSRLAVRDQVGGGDVHPGGQRPQVQLVDRGYARHRAQLGGDGLGVDSGGRVLAEHRDDLPDQDDRPDDHECGNRHSRDDVPYRQPGADDEQARHHHPDGPPPRPPRPRSTPRGR